jgi:hypothetical protein
MRGRHRDEGQVTLAQDQVLGDQGLAGPAVLGRSLPDREVGPLTTRRERARGAERACRKSTKLSRKAALDEEALADEEAHVGCVVRADP